MSREVSRALSSFVLHVTLCQSKSTVHTSSTDDHIQYHKIREHLFSLADEDLLPCFNTV